MLLLLLAAGLATGPRTWAHGDMHEQILNATKEVEKNPRDPELYLKRAELQRHHREWDAAQVDLVRAEALTNQWPILHLARARLFLDAEWFASAKVAADRFLIHEPNNAEACSIRARARVKLGERLAAVQDFTRAITNTARPAPELYIERAQALTAEGGEHLAAALQGLEEGMAALGPLVTLQSLAIDVEVRQKRVDAALARIDRVMAQFPRKETWLTRRGEILLQAGRNKEAAVAFQSALTALDTLPAGRRNVPAMVELEKHIRTSLAASGQPGAAPNP